MAADGKVDPCLSMAVLGVDIDNFPTEELFDHYQMPAMHG